MLGLIWQKTMPLNFGIKWCGSYTAVLLMYGMASSDEPGAWLPYTRPTKQQVFPVFHLEYLKWSCSLNHRLTAHEHLGISNI